MTTVDRLGFHVRLKTPDRMRGAHIAFSHEVRSAAETRKVWRHVATMYEIR
jgi:heme iron utilization protein